MDGFRKLDDKNTALFLSELPAMFQIPRGQFSVSHHTLRGQIIINEDSYKEAGPSRTTAAQETDADLTTLAVRLVPVERYNEELNRPGETLNQRQQKQLVPLAAIRSTSHVERTSSMQVISEQIHPQFSDLQDCGIVSPFACKREPVRWSDTDTDTRDNIIRRCKRKALGKALEDGVLSLDQIESLPLDWPSIALEFYEGEGLINLPPEHARSRAANPLVTRSRRSRIGCQVRDDKDFIIPQALLARVVAEVSPTEKQVKRWLYVIPESSAEDVDMAQP